MGHGHLRRAPSAQTARQLVAHASARRIALARAFRWGSAPPMTSERHSSSLPEGKLPPVLSGGFLHTLSFLTVAYIISFYTLLHNETFSIVSTLLALLMFALLSYQHLLRKPLNFPSLFWIPWVFALMNIASMFWSEAAPDGWEQIAMVCAAVIGASSVWLIVHNGGSVKLILYGQLIGSLALVASGFKELTPGLSAQRVAGLVGNANMMAMVLTYPMMLSWCIEGKNLVWYRLASVGLVLFAFLYTGSRRVVVSLALFVFYLAIHFLSRLTSRVTWRLLAASSIVLVVAAWIIDWNAVTARASDLLNNNQVLLRWEMLSGSREEASAENRRDMVVKALEIWVDNPILGIGAGQFTIKGGFGTYSHNNYVELLANLGVIGLLLFYALHVGLVVKTLTGKGRLFTDTAFRLSILLSVAGILILDLAAVTLISKAHWVLMVGLIALVEKKEKQALVVSPVSVSQPSPVEAFQNS
jgi:O-antigen ligase